MQFPYFFNSKSLGRFIPEAKDFGVFSPNTFIKIFVSTIALFLSMLILAAQDSAIVIPGHSLEAQRLFQVADQAIVAKDWLKAIEIYQKIFDKHSQDLVQKDPNLYVNAGYFAVQKIEQWPAEARTAYYNAVVGQAAPLLRSPGLQDRLPQIIRFLPLAETKASILHLVDRHLATEQYEEALSCLQFLRTYGNVQDSAAILARLGLCYYALGDFDSLEQLRNISPTIASVPLMIPDGSNSSANPGNSAPSLATPPSGFPPSQEADNASPLFLSETSWLRSLSTDQFVLDGKIQRLSSIWNLLEKKLDERMLTLNVGTSWAMLGGNPTRNFRIYQNFKMDTLPAGRQVNIPIPRRPEKKQYINEPDISFYGPAPYYPIVAENMVFIVNGQQVMALDIFSQQLRWTFTRNSSPLPSLGHEQFIHHAFYDQGALYVTLEDSTTIQPHNTYKIYYGEYQISRALSKRCLVKLDSQTGQMLWLVKDESDDTEAFGNRVSFMSPPVRWGKYLYVGASEFKGMFHAYLVVIQPEDGKIVSKISIISSQQELNMFGRPAREVVGSVVAVGNGFAYYLSDIGAVSCVDLNTEQVIWTYIYDRIIVPTSNAANYITFYRSNGCHNSPPILDCKQLYLAPVDANYIYALDAQHGTLKWKKNVGQNAFLMGVRKKKLIVASRNLEFWDVQTGASLTLVALSNVDTPVGMGLISDSHLYCAGESALYAVSLDQNVVTSQKNFRDSGRGPLFGHLAYANGTLFVAGRDTLYFFYDWNYTRLLLEQRIQKQPTVMDCLQLANLYQQRGKEDITWLEKSKEMFQKTISLSQHQPEHRRLAQYGLLKTYLDLAAQYRNGGQWAEAHRYHELAAPLVNNARDAIEIGMAEYYYFAQIEKNIDKACQILETLASRYGRDNCTMPNGQQSLVFIYAVERLSEHYLQKKQPELAIDWYQKAIANYGQVTYQNLSVAKWAQRQIRSIIAQYGQACYKKYDEESQQWYAKIKQAGISSITLQPLLQQYPNCEFASAWYIELAELLYQEEKYKEALWVLQNVQEEYPDTKEQMLAYFWMVECYETMKEYHRSKPILEKLQKLEKITVAWKGQTVLANEWATSQLSNPAYAQVLTQEQYLEFNAQQFITQELDVGMEQLVTPTGIPAKRYQNRIYLYYENLTCRDATTTEVLWSMPMPDILTKLSWNGDYLIGMSDRLIWRLDPDTGEMLWRQGLHKKLQNSDVINFVEVTSQGIVILDWMQRSNQSFLYLRSFENKDMIWQTGFIGRPKYFACNQKYVVTYTQVPPNLYIHSLEDGNVVQKFASEPEASLKIAVPHWAYYPILGDQSLYVYSQSLQQLSYFELPATEASWAYKLQNIKSSNIGLRVPLLMGNSSQLVFLRQNYELVVLNARSAEVRWTHPFNFPPQNIVLDGDDLYVLQLGDEDQSLWSFDTTTGKVKWIRRIMDNRASASYIHTTKYLAVLVARYDNRYRGNLLIYDKSKGEKLVDFDLVPSGNGRGYPTMVFSGGRLWIQKDSKIWIIGK